MLDVLTDALHRQQRWHEAADALAAAVRLRPHFPRALVNHGAALLQLSRPGEARAAFRRALALLPQRDDNVAQRARRGLRAAKALQSASSRAHEG